jgi:beta-phosphoglucomutase-like phosphatase (HAD superfamily)
MATTKKIATSTMLTHRNCRRVNDTWTRPWQTVAILFVVTVLLSVHGFAPPLVHSSISTTVPVPWTRNAQPVVSWYHHYRGAWNLPPLPSRAVRLAAKGRSNDEGETDWFRLFQRDEESDDDGSGNESEGDVPMPKRFKRTQRIKASFDKLFQGMPTMNDIFSDRIDDDDNNASPARTTSDVRNRKRRRESSVAEEDAWFEPERERIVKSYEQMQQDMLDKLNQQRRDDPESVPERAEAMIKSVLNQEMDREIKEAKDVLGEERLHEYEKEQWAEMEGQDVSELPIEPGVQKLIDDSEAEYERQVASRAEIDDFIKYEKEAVARTIKLDADVAIPAPGTDMDQWALERLREMADLRKDSNQEEVLDILEDSVSELSERIEKSASRGAARQETMKDWQMYRSIATRISQDDDSDPEVVTESQQNRISKSLDSWKEYVEKEESFRKSSGLTRGPKLPFEWQEAWERDTSSQKEDKRTSVQVRKDINRMSIAALEDLITKSDPARREKLQKELDYLKATLESKDYLDIEESEAVELEEKKGPIDLSDVLSYYKESSLTEAPPIIREAASSTTYLQPISPAPPSILSYDANEIAERKKPAPSTPFFEDSPVDLESDAVDSKLGDAEAQKLNAMFRRAGARTQKAQDEIKSQWEEYQELERKKREESGLSLDGSSSESDITTSARYNVSEVMKEDGDFDASKILAAIGPRPTRKKASPSTSQDEVINVPKSNQPGSSTPIEKELSDSLYRSVAAVGGGRYKDDPDEKAAQQKLFEEVLKKEMEMRTALDNMNDETLDQVIPEGSLDDAEYAEELIASLGPRPQVRRSRITDEMYLSDSGGATSDDSDDEEADDDVDIVLDARSQPESFADDTDIPEWLRLEQKNAGKPTRRKRFLGGEDIEEAFDDDKYDHNMRQLAEYERRRAGQQGRQMGIDISDVLRTRTDDYADYKYDTDYQRGQRSSVWGSESFAARKRNLLEYRELDVLELNSLMDHKGSVYATGVSQYTPRINRPFKEFGAIFRLEGVLVDISGLQMQAWAKVAQQFNYKLPLIEDVRRASVCRPEVAAREVFFWTEDFIQCAHIAAAHSKAMKDVFDEWAADNNITPVQSLSALGNVDKGSLTIGDELFSQSSSSTSNLKVVQHDEDKMIEFMYKAWTQTAATWGYEIKSEDDIFRAIMLSPDIAVRESFGWTTNPLDVDEIAAYYRKTLRALSQGDKVPARKDEPRKDVSSQQSSRAKVLTTTEMMEIQYQAWIKVAESNSFEKPTDDEVMAAFVINDPEVAVYDGFGWTDDKEVASRVANEYRDTVRDLLLGIQPATEVPVNKQIKPLNQEQAAPESSSEVTSNGAPTDDEIFDMIAAAWDSTAGAYGYDTPSRDQIKLAMNMDIDEVVTRLFRWSNDPKMIGQISSTLDAEFERRSMALIEKYDLELSDEPVSAVETETPKKQNNANSDDIFKVVMGAWTATARRLGFEDPDDEQVQFALSVGPEEAIMLGFDWASDPEKVKEIMDVYRDELGQRRTVLLDDSAEDETANVESEKEPLVKFIPGAQKWIQSLKDVEMQCGIISYLDRDQVTVLLREAGLSDLIPPENCVTAADSYNRDTYQMLGAALRIERRPDHCVVFDSSPYSSVAAHDVEMRSVAMINPFPRYELLSADSTASSFDEFTAMNIRRLFGERVYDQPMMDMQQAQPATQKKQKTKYFWDDD